MCRIKFEEIKFARKAAEVALHPRRDGSRLGTDEIENLVTQLKGIVEILKERTQRTAGRSTGS